MKMLPVPQGWHGSNEETTQHGSETRTNRSRARAIPERRATIDRLLQPVRASAKQDRRKASLNTPLRKSINVRTYEDWKNPAPGPGKTLLVGIKAAASVRMDALGWPCERAGSRLPCIKLRTNS